jgi:hypothetical protein
MIPLCQIRQIFSLFSWPKTAILKCKSATLDLHTFAIYGNSAAYVPGSTVFCVFQHTSDSSYGQLLSAVHNPGIVGYTLAKQALAVDGSFVRDRLAFFSAARASWRR